MARKYKRDSNGRFAGGGGGSSGGSKRPAAKTVSRGVNRLTRDNAGKITSVGGSGATSRGGRLKTASGNKRATQTAKVSGGKPSGAISKKPRGISDSDKQSMRMAKALRSGKPNPAVDAVRRRQENSAASRRQANSLAKGNLLKTTEADRRNRAQSLATAQRKLSEMERTGSGRNRLSGSNTALLGQRAQVAALSKPLPEFRKPNRSDVVAKNRDALARRRAERQNAKTMSDFRARTAKPAAAPKPAARTSKAPANAAKARYKRAAGAARAQNSDLRGASASSRRAANTAAAKVRLMERSRSTALPKAAADSPRSRQQSRQIGRIKRAQANQAQAMKNENAGPNSKMSRKASVAKRAQQIYSGKVNPKEKTNARLTKTNNPEALRKRVAKIKDNTAKRKRKP